MKKILELIGRNELLFSEDIIRYSEYLSDAVSNSTFLVLGAAGSIGQAVTKEIFKRKPKKLHAVDISENNLTELVRDIRSSFGYCDGEFKTYALDIGSAEYDAFIEHDTQQGQLAIAGLDANGVYKAAFGLLPKEEEKFIGKEANGISTKLS